MLTGVLITGAVLEGYYGGRLAHRGGDVTCELAEQNQDQRGQRRAA
jgi:hypothetical protein